MHRAYSARQSWRTLIFPFAVAGVGGLLCIPFYAALSRIDRYHGPSIELIVRPCPSEDDLSLSLTQTLGLDHSPEMPAPLAKFLVRLLGLVPQYLVEFGFFFLAAVYWLRTGVGCRDPNGLFRRLAVMCWCALVIGSLFVSVRTWNCDLNWRILHPVQIVLAGIGAAFWLHFWKSRKNFLDIAAVVAFLAIGAAGSLYDWTRTRFDVVWIYPEQPALAARARKASAFINQQFPTARIQFDPGGNPLWILHLRGTVVVSDYNFNVWVYGVDQKEVEQVIEEMKKTFDPATSPEKRWEILKRLRIELLILEPENDLFKKPLNQLVPPGAASLVREWDDCKIIRLSGE
jgi:hypothetical protein